MSTSNNATSADNQQERLIKLGWIVGFVDGEGCFSIGFIKQPDREESLRIRRGYRMGVQAWHEFAVTQGMKSLSSLKKVRNFFGVGNLYLNQRHDNHKEHLYRYAVRKRADLLRVIIPFFEKHHLQTSKNNDFRLFAQCVRMMSQNKHLERKGLIKILKLSEQMNHKKSKNNLIRILRNQTPTTPFRRE